MYSISSKYYREWLWALDCPRVGIAIVCIICEDNWYIWFREIGTFVKYREKSLWGQLINTHQNGLKTLGLYNVGTQTDKMNRPVEISPRNNSTGTQSKPSYASVVSKPDGINIHSYNISVHFINDLSTLSKICLRPSYDH